MSRALGIAFWVLALAPAIAMAQSGGEPIQPWPEAGFRAGDLQLPSLGASHGRQALEVARWKLKHPLISPDVRPVFPGDETVERNLQILRERQGAERLAHWLDAVRTGGVWDYKAHHSGGWRTWQDAGNFNYAATGMEVLPDSIFGWSVPKSEVLLFGAGTVQLWSNLQRVFVSSMPGSRSPLEWPCGAGAYCDNPEDSRVIEEAAEWMEDFALREFLAADPLVVTFEIDSLFGRWRAEYSLRASYDEAVADSAADRAATEREEPAAEDPESQEIWFWEREEKRRLEEERRRKEEQRRKEKEKEGEQGKLRLTKSEKSDEGFPLLVRP